MFVSESMKHILATFLRKLAPTIQENTTHHAITSLASSLTGIATTIKIPYVNAVTNWAVKI